SATWNPFWAMRDRNARNASHLARGSEVFLAAFEKCGAQMRRPHFSNASTLNVPTGDVEDAISEVNDQVTAKTPDVTSNEEYTYRVAKAPAFPNTPLRCLEQAYGASEFLPALKTFIQQTFTSRPLLPNEYDRFNVYNTIHVMLPSQPHVSDRKRQQTIHATPDHNKGPRKRLSPARFDTALIIEDADLYREEGGLHGMYITIFIANLTNNLNMTCR